MLQEGSYALVFKSRHFPGEMVATRHGSPMMIGIKSASTLATDNFPVLFSNEKGFL
jgi:glucosamine--fructose-6-phosphate aminotransferase (isomerizing)